MGLTRVQRSEGKCVIEGATVSAQAMIKVIVVERVQRCNHYVAGPTLL